MEVVKAILNGDLLVEEAMAKYQIKDKRTIGAWIRKFSPFLQATKEAGSLNPAAIFCARDSHTPRTRDYDTLLKHIHTLETKIQQLEDINKLVLQNATLLAEKVNVLISEPNAQKLYK